MTLEELNDLAPNEFAEALDGVFEHASWVAAAVAPYHPFTSSASLHATLMHVVQEAPEEQLLAFLRGHPELTADKLSTDLTDASRAEQEGLAMHQAESAGALPALNQAYRERFGFPFIVCVTRHTAEDVLRNLHARILHEPCEERERALAEISHITWLRLLVRLGGVPKFGYLSTHVLDTQLGAPAAGLALSLFQENQQVCKTVTDQDGRVGALLPAPLRQGLYELVFDVGSYFAKRGIPTLYTLVPIRFMVTLPETNYHIPLLLSPYGYTTYQGS